MIYYIDYLSKPASNMNAEMLKVEKKRQKKSKTNKVNTINPQVTGKSTRMVFL